MLSASRSSTSSRRTIAPALLVPTLPPPPRDRGPHLFYTSARTLRVPTQFCLCRFKCQFCRGKQITLSFLVYLCVFMYCFSCFFSHVISDQVHPNLPPNRRAHFLSFLPVAFFSVLPSTKTRKAPDYLSMTTFHLGHSQLSSVFFSILSLANWHAIQVRAYDL